jgi:hypothetical protein
VQNFRSNSVRLFQKEIELTAIEINGEAMPGIARDLA